MLAGLGLCLLLGGHLLMVHIVSSPQNSAYNKMTMPYAYHTQHTAEAGPSASIPRLSIPSTMPMATLAIRKSYTDDNPPKSGGEFQDQYHHHQQCGAGIIGRFQYGSHKQLGPMGPCDHSKMHIAIKRDIEDPTDKPKESLDDHPFGVEWMVKERYNNLAKVHLLLFIAAQGFLIALLTTLFLGVLIMTESALDQADKDIDQQRWHYWSRIMGIAFASLASAVHGSYLSGYVLLNGQPDGVMKAAVGMICIYWLSMPWITNRVAGPLPY
ncbi:hypothetical protein BGZ51_009307 [Haplosporangium sp. Z 767]|nr:hypothetical protein BGZ50_003479 [Haplosporangium sp. Z 11]KAF9189765.1 hypothetical protein BGZ51_009307 [Haplosporangium sp. Z 767]